MKAKSQKNSSTKSISNFFNNLYDNFLRLEFLMYLASFPIGLKWKIPKTFKSPIIYIFSLEYFALKSIYWTLNKGNNQRVLTWEMHGGPSTTSIVILI